MNYRGIIAVDGGKNAEHVATSERRSSRLVRDRGRLLIDLGSGYGAYRSLNGSNWSLTLAGDWRGVVGISASDVLFVPGDGSQRFSRWLGSDQLDINTPGTLCTAPNAAWPVNATSYVDANRNDFVPADACALGTVGYNAPTWPMATGACGSGFCSYGVHAASPNAIYADDGQALGKLVGSAFVPVDTKLTFSNDPLTERLLFSARDEDDIWVVNDRKGTASHWDGQSWTPSTICAGVATRVAIAPDGSAYAGCGKQVYTFAGSGWASLHTFDATVDSIAAGADQLWASANGVFRQASPDWVAAPLPNGTSGAHLDGVDASQTLWADLGETPQDRYGRIGALHDGRWNVYTFPALDQTEVRGNEVWTVSYGMGTYRFNGEKFDGYATGDATAMYHELSIAGPGEVWLESDGGLLRYRDPK